MKLDSDLVRELLFFFEAKDNRRHIESKDIQIANHSSEQIAYTLVRMYEAGFLSGEAVRSTTTPERIIRIIPFELSARGHEFLDAVRDPAIWRKTKAGAAKIGGAGVEVLWDLAKAYGKHLIKTKLNLDLGD